MTAEAIQKAALKSQKRKQLADEKREKDKVIMRGIAFLMRILKNNAINIKLFSLYLVFNSSFHIIINFYKKINKYILH